MHPKLITIIASLFMTTLSKTLLLFALIYFSSCVSNKKHQATLDLRDSEHLAAVNRYQAEIDSLKNKVYKLELNVAERIGENNILLVLREELQTEISNLESTFLRF